MTRRNPIGLLSVCALAAGLNMGASAETPDAAPAAASQVARTAGESGSRPAGAGAAATRRVGPASGARDPADGGAVPLPLDPDGKVKVSTSPKSMTYDTGELEINAGQFPAETFDVSEYSSVPVQGPIPMGTVDLDGFDSVSIQLISIRGPGRIELRSEWRNGEDGPFTPRAVDCLQGPWSGDAEPCVDLFRSGSLFAWPGESVIKQVGAVARQLQLSVLANTPGTYRFRVVAYLRRSG